VVSIACRTGVSLLHLNPRNAPVTGDFGSDIWNVFQKAAVPFELIGTSRKEMSLLIDETSLTPELNDRLAALAEIEVQEHRALVTLVGHNASRNPENLVRATQQVRKIPGGAALAWCSDSRFAFVLDARELNLAAEALHCEFFGEPHPDLFVQNRSSVIVMENPQSARPWLGLKDPG
jgi:aspartate kinase